jgi:hypothetical protein
MWTQPTSGTILQHTVLPEYALARGKIGNTTSYKTVIGSPKSWPLVPWEQLAYVQIDLVGSFTATAGCVIYDGGAWPEEYNGDYFTTEPTINVIITSGSLRRNQATWERNCRGASRRNSSAAKTCGGAHRSARRPGRRDVCGDFYNQAVIHNDTRGPDHNRVNAAVRPDRDHYFGRIWRLDHKQAKRLPVPDLSKAGVAELVKAIEHPNRAVRMNALVFCLSCPIRSRKRKRLWLEGEQEQYAAMMEKNFGYNSLKYLALDASKPTEARVAALWILGRRDAEVLMLGWDAALADKDPVIRRNAAQVAELPQCGQFLTTKLIPLLDDADAPTRLAALQALVTKQPFDEPAKALVAAWAKLDDDYQRSAAVGAASRNPAPVIAAALDSSDAAALAPLVSAVTQNITAGRRRGETRRRPRGQTRECRRAQAQHPRFTRKEREGRARDDARAFRRARANSSRAARAVASFHSPRNGTKPARSRARS